MTDEIYRCDECGSTECNGYSEFLKNGVWYNDEMWEATFSNDVIPDDERRICGSTGEVASSSIVSSTLRC